MDEITIKVSDYLSKEEMKEAQRDPWKPSIHMPREAARLFLEVKSVRVERLQDITEKDAQAEGVGILPSWAERGTYRRGFEALWYRLNSKRGYSWESNPWVFVYEFMRKGSV